MEVTERERLRREDVASRPHALADALARNNEIGDDQRELQVELKW